MIKLQLRIFRSSPSLIKFPPLASAPTVRYQTGPPISLTDDGSSFLQVVLCYQLHIPVPQKKEAFCPVVTHTNTNKLMGTHTADKEGQTPADCLSPRLLTSATVWHCGKRRPSGVGRVGLEGDQWAQCITLLFSVGLRCARWCVVKMLVFSSFLMGFKYYENRQI